MAEANDSRGLKIAVAAFITLTVILAVTSYFLYASVMSAQARRDFAEEANAKARRSTSVALMQYDEMRARIGTKAVEFDPAREEISANFKNVDERLNNLVNAVNAAVQTAQQNGAQGPELEDAKLNVQKVIASYRSDPNRNYISSLERLTELAEKLALLTTQLSLKYVGLRKSHEGATSVPNPKRQIR